MRKIAFDLGAHEGHDIEYYLSKFDTVVAVEANPNLCKKIELKYTDFIIKKRLFVVNKCLTVNENLQKVDFYINRYTSGHSMFTKPTKNANDYDITKINSITLTQLFSEFGVPYFIKIDLEGYDKFILNYLINHNMLPEYLQFENNGVDILNKILDLNYYISYNIVAFYNFEKFYNKENNLTAGPIGADIKSVWLDKNEIIKIYKLLPHNWVDIHCTTKNYNKEANYNYEFYNYTKPPSLILKEIVPHKLKVIIKNFFNIKK